MADLNQGQLSTTTGRQRQKILQYQIQDVHPVTMAMEEMGGIRRVAGGRNISEEFAFQSTGTAAWIPENGEVPLTQRQLIDRAEFNWYHAGGSYTISGPERRMNGGGSDTQYIDIVSAKQTILEEEMTNIYHSAVLSSGSAANQLPGLLALVSKTPATGTLGGITVSGSNAAFYRNHDFDTAADWADGAADSGNIKRLLSKQLNATTYRGAKRFGVLGVTYYEYLEQALQAHVRLAKVEDDAGQTHDYLPYRGVKWYFGGGVNFSGESDIQDDLSYLLTPGKGKLQITFHKDAEFEFLSPVNARNQDAITRLMILQVAFSVNMRKLQSTAYDS